MRSNIPVLPIAVAALLRGLTAVYSGLKAFLRAYHNRRQAQVLSGLDRQMLADMGITRADLNDAFSGPFWDDPTALLRERALERRLARKRRAPLKEPGEKRFACPPADAARHAI